MIYSKALNILPCVNGPFEYFRKRTGEKRTWKALRSLTRVSRLQRNWGILYITVRSRRARHFIHVSNSVCMASACLWVCFSTGFHAKLGRWRRYEWCADRATDIAENEGRTEVFFSRERSIFFQLSVCSFSSL